MPGTRVSRLPSGIGANKLHLLKNTPPAACRCFDKKENPMIPKAAPPEYSAGLEAFAEARHR